MKRIFLDTNFIVDYYVREDYKEVCENVMTLGYNMGASFYLSYLTVANFAYIIRKEPKETIELNVNNLCSLFNVVSNTRKQILKTIEISPEDFEDGLQYITAKEAKCEIIITRNKKDFQFSDIRVLSPQEFLEQYQ